MKLLIDKETLVEDVKRLFVNNYPFLKIELYKPLQEAKQTHAKKEPLPSNVALSKFFKNINSAVINCGEDITVEALENQFKNIDLDAEIFRKSGTVWVETSLTDNWTLQQQNAEAEEISKHFSLK
jgi:hypothetical protein